MHARREGRAPARRSSRRSARIVALLCSAFILALVLGIVPGLPGTAMSAALPWMGLLLVPLALAAFTRARRTLTLVLVASLAWVWAVHPSLPAWPQVSPGSILVVASQNVHSDTEAARESAQTLLESDPDVVVFTELPPDSRWAADEALAARLPHRFTVGTLSVWSADPLVDGEALELDLGWKRALRVTVQAANSDVVVYAIHAASVRPGHQAERDEMLRALGHQLGADTSGHVVVVGDFNAAPTDPALNPVKQHVRWVPPSDGTWGMSWPAAFPVVRLDHVFAKGLGASTATVRAGSSDHLATVSTFSIE